LRTRFCAHLSHRSQGTGGGRLDAPGIGSEERRSSDFLSILAVCDGAGKALGHNVGVVLPVLGAARALENGGPPKAERDQQRRKNPEVLLARPWHENS